MKTGCNGCRGGRRVAVSSSSSPQRGTNRFETLAGVEHYPRVVDRASTQKSWQREKRCELVARRDLLQQAECTILIYVSWRDTLQSILRSATQRRTETITLGIDSTESLGSSECVPVSKAIWQRRYEIVRELDEGGMAKVLLAKRRSDALQVCLKFLSPPRISERASKNAGLCYVFGIPLSLASSISL